MQKMSILARIEDQDRLLQSLQSFRNVQIIDLSHTLSDDLLPHFTSPKVEARVRELSQQLDLIEESIEYLSQYAKPQPLWKTLTHSREVYTLEKLDREVNQMDLEVLLNVVKDQKQEIDDLTKKIDLAEEEEAFVRQWQKLPFHPQALYPIRTLNVVLGTIETDDNEAFTQEVIAMGGHLEEIFYSPEIMNYMIIINHVQEEQLQAILTKYTFKPLIYPYVSDPQTKLQEILTRREKLITQRLNKIQSLHYTGDILWYLKLTKEYIYNAREREKARQLIVNSANLFMVSGWTPEVDVEAEMAEVHRVMSGRPLAMFTEDVQLDEYDKVPIVLDNAHIIGPFETITAQYSLPKYGEKDPTPYFYPFHILFFGMMSGDLGYGIVLWLLTFIPLNLFDLSPRMQKNLRFFHQLSYGTMAVGLFFGSFFGFNLPFKVMDITGDVIQVMLISVAIGLVHLFLAYLLKAVDSYKEKDWAGFYLDAVQWLLMIIGIVVLAINALFLGNLPILQTVGIWLVIGNIIGMFIVNVLASRNKVVGIGKGLFGLIGTAGFMGDIISYTRLAALGVSGANIGMAFNMILGMLPPLLRFTLGLVLFLALHALNIFLSFLGAYVHGMRLEYVEFFGKFYGGGGKPLRPLQPLEEVIWIKKEKR